MRNRVEGERDAQAAVVGRHLVQQIARKQQQIARAGRRADPLLGVEGAGRRRRVGVAEDEVAPAQAAQEHGVGRRVALAQVQDARDEAVGMVMHRLPAARLHRVDPQFLDDRRRHGALQR